MFAAAQLHNTAAAHDASPTREHLSSHSEPMYLLLDAEEEDARRGKRLRHITAEALILAVAPPGLRLFPRCASSARTRHL